MCLRLLRKPDRKEARNKENSSLANSFFTWLFECWLASGAGGSPQSAAEKHTLKDRLDQSFVFNQTCSWIEEELHIPFLNGKCLERVKLVWMQQCLRNPFLGHVRLTGRHILLCKSITLNWREWNISIFQELNACLSLERLFMGSKFPPPIYIIFIKLDMFMKWSIHSKKLSKTVFIVQTWM